MIIWRLKWFKIMLTVQVLYHCIHTLSITYLLTPWYRVLLEKLTGLQLVKKSPAFHGTRRFITALTSVRHLSLSWASPIQSIYPQPTSCRSVLILSTHLRLGLPSGLFPSGLPTKKCQILVKVKGEDVSGARHAGARRRWVFSLTLQPLCPLDNVTGRGE